VVGLLINKLRNVYAESESEIFKIDEYFAPVRLANTLLKDGESARNNHVLVCNFAKYLPI